MGVAGEICDRERFSSYIMRNMALQKYRTGNDMDLEAIAEYTRSELAYAIRRGPFQTNIILAGVENDEAKLYWIDYMGTMCQMTKGAHGYAAYFVGSILDNFYKKGMSIEDGLECMKKCVHEMKTRFLLDQSYFQVKIVTKDGSRVENI